MRRFVIIRKKNCGKKNCNNQNIRNIRIIIYKHYTQ